MAKEKAHSTVILGIMSGTSLDGLDLALVEFYAEKGNFAYRFLKSKTIPYSSQQKEKLTRACMASAEQYFALNHLFGKYIAKEVNEFLQNVANKPNAIASHGHTVFHQPATGFSTQIGCGATIAACTGITTVCDFRSLDVANGGQGAPLVPVGDKFLFSEYDACLNIGGIANISFNRKGEQIAFDVCFANMILNYLAEKRGKAYDENGGLASSGKTDPALLQKLKNLLHNDNKISLAREQFEKGLLPFLSMHHISVEDKLATFCDFISDEIVSVLNSEKIGKVLVTGGGAYNLHLISKIKEKFNGEVIIPDDQTIQFKEALIFAFLAYLRLQEKTNTLKSVTGAKSDSAGGAVYFVN